MEVSKFYFSRLKRNAKYRKIDFDIDLEYLDDLFIKQDRKCFLSGKELEFSKSYEKKNRYYSGTTASLDRKDSSIGYFKDNVQWIHKDLNFMKNDFSTDEFINWCKLVAEHTGGA